MAQLVTWVSGRRFTARIDPRSARLVSPVKESVVGFNQEGAFLTVEGKMTLVECESGWIYIHQLDPDS